MEAKENTGGDWIVKPDTWLTVPEAAKELRIPRSRAYSLISEGHLPAVRLGEKSIRVNRQELEDFLFCERRVSLTESPTLSSKISRRNEGGA